MKTGAVIAIVGGSVVVIGGGAYLLLRKPSPKGQSLCQKIAGAAAIGGGVAAGVPVSPGIAQAAGGVACSILDQLGGALAGLGNFVEDVAAAGGKAITSLVGYLPPVLLAKGAIKVGEAAYDAGDKVVTTGYHLAGSALDTGGHYIKVAGKDIYKGAAGVEHAAVDAAHAVGSTAKKVLDFVNPF